MLIKLLFKLFIKNILFKEPNRKIEIAKNLLKNKIRFHKFQMKNYIIQLNLMILNNYLMIG